MHRFNNPLQFLTRRYTTKLRRGPLDTLSLLDIDHTALGGQLLSCVNAILHYRSDSMLSLAVQAVVDFDDNADVLLDWVRDSCHSILYGEQQMKMVIPDEALRRLSPYRSEHINLLGEYTIEIPINVSRQHTKLG